MNSFFLQLPRIVIEQPVSEFTFQWFRTLSAFASELCGGPRTHPLFCKMSYDRTLVNFVVLVRKFLCYNHRIFYMEDVHVRVFVDYSCDQRQFMKSGWIKWREIFITIHVSAYCTLISLYYFNFLTFTFFRTSYVS